MTEERTRPCDRCGRIMIRHSTGIVFASYPAKHQWEWWCGCGHRTTGGYWTEQTDEEILHAEWERANGEAQ